jgi:hypothetical protein
VSKRFLVEFGLHALVLKTEREVGVVAGICDLLFELKTFLTVKGRLY